MSFRRIWQWATRDMLGTVTLVLSTSFTILGVPAQALKIWQTGSVADISIMMYALLAAQAFCWILYGTRERRWVIVVPNIFALSFGAIILAQCAYYYY